MTAMLLDHRLDSAREVSKSDTIVSIRISLQSYNEIDGIVVEIEKIIFPWHDSFDSIRRTSEIQDFNVPITSSIFDRERPS